MKPLSRHKNRIWLPTWETLWIMGYEKPIRTWTPPYWQVGRRIVEEEQNGDKRAGYGTRLITTLAEALSHDYSRGFTARDLRNYRQFYLCFNDLEIWYTRVPNHSAALSIYREQKYPHLKLAYYIRTPNVNWLGEARIIKFTIYKICKKTQDKVFFTFIFTWFHATKAMSRTRKAALEVWFPRSRNINNTDTPEPLD